MIYSQEQSLHARFEARGFSASNLKAWGPLLEPEGEGHHTL